MARSLIIAGMCAALASPAAAQTSPCTTLPANARNLPWDLDFVADEGIRVDNASLAKPFVDEGGRVHLLYQSEPAPHRNMYAVSDDGLAFTGHRTELPDDLRYHPYRVRMPNGVWRMFSWSRETGQVTSRSSSDGATFSNDFGVRYELQPDDAGWMGIHDEYVDGVARVVMLYLGDMHGLNNTRRAVSTDNGWTFTFDRGDVLGDSAEVRQRGPEAAYVDQKSTHLDGAARRLFAMKQGCAIYSFVTTDGDGYVLEPGYRVSVTSWPGLSIRSLHDPLVVRLADGGFRMYLAALVLGAPGTLPSQVILSATARVR